MEAAAQPGALLSAVFQALLLVLLLLLAASALSARAEICIYKHMYTCARCAAIDMYYRHCHSSCSLLLRYDKHGHDAVTGLVRDGDDHRRTFGTRGSSQSQQYRTNHIYENILNAFETILASVDFARSSAK